MATVKKRRRPPKAKTEPREPVPQLAAVARSIYAQTRPLNGLTKTSARLLRIAASWSSAEVAGASGHNGKAGSAGRPAGLSAAERAIVLRAVEPGWPSGAAIAPGPPLTSKPKALEAIAARVAAVFELARAVTEVNPQAESVPIQDDGQSVELVVESEADEASAAVLHRTALWNRVAIRPCELSLSVEPAQRTPWIRGDQAMAEAGRRVLQRHAEAFLSRQYGLAYRADVEYVHELRVATRRLRAAMRVFGRSFRGRLKEPAARFQELAAVLGEARDCDVFLDFLRSYTERNPKTARWLNGLVRSERRRRREAYRRVEKTLAAPACQRFLHTFYESLKGPAGSEEELIPAGKGLSRTAAQGARKALRRALGKTTAYGRRIGALSGPQQHELRIACKKLRYAAEFFAEIFPPALAKLIKTATELQDLLGAAHDTDVYAQRIEDYFRRSRSRKSAKVMRAVRASLRGQGRRSLARADRIWKRFTAGSTQAALARLVSSGPTP